MRWSYKTVHFALKKDGLLGGSFLDEAEIEETLNDFGQAGWELVSLLDSRDGAIGVFKQAIEAGARPGRTAFEDAGPEDSLRVVPAVIPDEDSGRLGGQPEDQDVWIEEDDAGNRVEEEPEPVVEPEVEAEDEAEDDDPGVGSIRIE